jgi:hypothetical protein
VAINIPYHVADEIYAGGKGGGVQEANSGNISLRKRRGAIIEPPNKLTALLRPKRRIVEQLHPCNLVTPV